MGGSSSLPLQVDGETVGALDLYATERGAMTDDAHEPMLAFAARASGAMDLVSKRQEDAEQAQQLREALESRSVIDQALGMLMAREKVDADEAFALLRAASTGSNRKLRDLAAELVRQASGKPLVAPPTFRRRRGGGPGATSR